MDFLTRADLEDPAIPAFVDSQGDYFRREEDCRFTVVWKDGMVGQLGSYSVDELVDTVGEPFYGWLEPSDTELVLEAWEEVEPIGTVVISQQEFDDLYEVVNQQADLQETPRAAVLIEAATLITGDRNKTYGSPTQNFQNTADIWTVLLSHKLKDGERFTATEVGTFMVALKLARTIAQPKRDNFVDIAGYAGCAWETLAEAEGLDPNE